ncbi:MAG: DUF1993 domain-containing protein [bacterium]|nr:DUF1993 domain-containing protein [bacterium]
MTLYDLAVPTFLQMLKGLSVQLDKGLDLAKAEGDDLETLLAARLAPDMFPLSAQVRYTCYQATDAVAKLTGLTGPGRPEGDAPEALKAHIAAAVAFVNSAPAAAFDGAAERTITLTLPGDLVFEMTGLEFLRDWALPQFYFHAVTAYDILRHKGVALGKRDFVAHALAYLKA